MRLPSSPVTPHCCCYLHRLKGGTPLLIAAQFGHVEVVKHLLTVKGVDMDAQNTAGFTALMRAADAVRVLSLPAFVSLPACSHLPPTLQGRADVAEALLQAGCNGDLQDSYGMPNIKCACV